MAGRTDRRGEILMAAGKLFASRGISATTVRQIGDEVGLLSGSLYHHFRSKDEIVQEIILDYLHELHARYDEVLAKDLRPKDALIQLVRASLATIENHPHATEIYLQDAAHLRALPQGEKINALARLVPKRWLAIIGEGVTAGHFRDDVPPRIFYNVIRDSLWQSVMWFDPHSKHTREQLADDLLAIYLEGFGSRAAASGAALASPG